MVVPIMIKTFSLMVAVILTGLSLVQNRYRVAMTSSIICVYLKVDFNLIPLKSPGRHSITICGFC